VPFEELIKIVPESALSVSGGQAVPKGGFCLVHFGEPKNRFRFRVKLISK
jgi:hypothetical protein